MYSKRNLKDKVFMECLIQYWKVNIKGSATKVWGQSQNIGNLAPSEETPRAHGPNSMCDRGKCCNNVLWEHFVGLSTGLMYI